MLAKHAMRDRGIPTPDFYAFNETAFGCARAPAQALPAIEDRLAFPIVVKPARQGSALGIKFARTAADVPTALVAAFSYDRKVLLERYVEGRELAVSIVEDIDPGRPPGGAADRRGGPRAGGLLRLRGALRDRPHPLRVPGRARRARSPRAPARSRWRPTRLLGCAGFARVDLMLEAATSELYVLEVNPIPGLDRDEPAPQAAEAAGIASTRWSARAVARSPRARQPDRARDAAGALDRDSVSR